MPTPVQIVWSFDTTGSMSSCINELKVHIKELSTKLLQTLPGLEIGIIAHGDYCDEGKTYLVKTLPFSRSASDIHYWMQNVEDTSGGDAPEAYEVALRTAVQDFCWKPTARKILVLIGDDVPHEPSYSMNTNRIDWQVELGRLKTIGVECFGVQCCSREYACWFYEAVSQRTGGTWLPMKEPKYISELFFKINSAGLSEEPLPVLTIPGVRKRVCAGAKLSGVVFSGKTDLAAFQRLGTLDNFQAADVTGKCFLAVDATLAAGPGLDACLMLIVSSQVKNQQILTADLQVHHSHPIVKIMSMVRTQPYPEALALVPTGGSSSPALCPGVVVNKQVTLFHGTSLSKAHVIQSNGFIPSVDGCLGGGVYFADHDKAARFAHDRFAGEPALLKCCITVKQPKYVKGNCKSWQAEGYDACWTQSTNLSPLPEWCVLKPAQVTVLEVINLAGTKRPVRV